MLFDVLLSALFVLIGSLLCCCNAYLEELEQEGGHGGGADAVAGTIFVIGRPVNDIDPEGGGQDGGN